MARPIRVLLAGLEPDTHAIDITVIAHALRDAGMEVIFTGLAQTPEALVGTAIQEDVDAICIPSPSAAQPQLPRVMELLRAQGAGDPLVVAVDADADAGEIVARIRNRCRERVA